MEGYVNVDFEDVNTVMRDSGVAIMEVLPHLKVKTALRRLVGCAQ